MKIYMSLGVAAAVVVVIISEDIHVHVVPQQKHTIWGVNDEVVS